MNAQDFNRLNGLLSKLTAAANKTAREDGSFRKYNSQSIEALKDFQAHLKQLENGLRTAKVVDIEPSSISSTIMLSKSTGGLRATT